MTTRPMCTKANPSPNGCYERAAPDEPMFVLLGRDPTAPFVILFWSKMRALMNLSEPEHLVEAGVVLEQMRDWAVKLGKTEKLGLAFEAFRIACFEVAKAEMEAAILPTEVK